MLENREITLNGISMRNTKGNTCDCQVYNSETIYAILYAKIKILSIARIYCLSSQFLFIFQAFKKGNLLSIDKI
jgi:hypothetical protein